MNLAFNSLLIILLALPGFIFTLSLYQSDESSHTTSLTNRTILSLVISILFLIFLPAILSKIFEYQINYGLLLEIIGGKNNDAFLKGIALSSLVSFEYYIIFSYTLSYTLGLIFNYAIKKFKLDTKLQLPGINLRLESPWYYLLKGYDWKIGEPDLVIITAATELAGQGYLYHGYLEDYYLNKNGELDRIILTDTRRRAIENDHPSSLNQEKTKESVDERFYPIDGHNFVLKYSDIKSLNIQFIKIDFQL
jgi:hypothetical protein